MSMIADVIGYFALTALVFTVLLFLKAALFKGFDFLEFQGYVADYQLLPDRWVRPAAMAIVVLECLTVLTLLFEATRMIGVVLAVGLLTLYAVSMGINLKRGRSQIECGCGGVPQYLSPRLLVRNAVLMVIALLPLAGLPQAMSASDTLLPLLAGLFMFAMYALIEQINANVMALQSPRL